MHSVDGKLDVHVTLGLAASAGVDELPRCLGDDGVPIVTQPIEQGANRGEFLVLIGRGVLGRAQKRSVILKLDQQSFVVNVEPERFRR